MEDSRRNIQDDQVRPRLVASRRYAQEQLEIRVGKGRRLLGQTFDSIEQLAEAEREDRKWDTYNKDLLASLFENQSMVKRYERSNVFRLVFDEDNLEARVANFKTSLMDRIDWLDSLAERVIFFAEANEMTVPGSTSLPSSSPAESNSIFVVHGHDESARETVARFLERLGFKPIILHEQANRGLTIIEKFESNARVVFAVVLLTPDDECLGDSQSTKRARQNVVFELGYFFGTLGRGRVAALYKEGVELPSDVGGLAYIPFDGTTAWKLQLAQELKAVGLAVDMNRLL